jgi:serine/threonine-protein kinase
LLDEALDLPEGERPRWLASLGASHEAVRPWLTKVITPSSGFSESSFQRPTITGLTESEFNPGQRVGPYLLGNKLGQGGMSEVWLASRSDGALSRQVALKLPHSYLLAGVPRRRFERERDILAALSHPHIAQLYDAGVADSQHPYLAMEWVNGVSIVEYCSNTKLSLERRLDLFLQILEAVGYAHERLIAHRDIKPSNILVTGDGRVKLLDFGIAKLLASDADDGATELTQIGSCLATPDYAAPEQLAGEPITVAADIYALGVVLYELLAGRRPFTDTRKALSGRKVAPRASSQIEPGHAQRVGGLNDKQLRRALNGDLDAIVAKALESVPARRYRSAESFALDIQRRRHHLPIAARHVGPATLALKFVRRHWVGAAMTAGLIVAFLGGSAGIAWQAVRAEREAQRATTIKDFLVGMFRASDPRISADKPRGEITARELLDISAPRIEGAFAHQPATEVELLGVSADIYRALDETRRSTALYIRETELARQYYGAADTHAIDGLLGQAFNANVDGDREHALLLLDQANPLIRRAGLEASAARARWLLIRGEALVADAAKGDVALTSIQAAGSLFRAVAPQDPLYVVALSDLGGLFLERSEFALSANYYRQAILAGEPNTQLQGNILAATSGLAVALKDLGDFRGAAAAFEHSASIAARTYGQDSNKYWTIASDWARFRYERGDRKGALIAFETLLQSLPRDRDGFRNATDALEATEVLRKYGRCLATDGQGTRAIQLLERAQALLMTSASHVSDAARLQLDLAKAYEAAGRIADARAAFVEVLKAFEAHQAPASQLATARERWGRFLLAQKDIDSARKEFLETLRLSAGHVSEAALYAQAGLASIGVSAGDARGALETSGRAMEQLNHLEGSYDIRIQPYVWTVRARSLLLTGDVEGARSLAKHALEAEWLYYAPDNKATSEAGAFLKTLASNTTSQR